MRLASLLPALGIVAGVGCAGASDLRSEGGCPPGVPCESAPRLDGEAQPLSVRRGLEPRLDALPLVASLHDAPKVGRLRGQGSLSVGGPTTGFVVGCRSLPAEGSHHRILEEQSRRGTACATDDLVDGLLAAAAAVDKARPGARLTVGNLGRVGGGGIPWSVSHRSGRDADLGLYLLGPDGKQFVPTTLVPLDRGGRAEVDCVPVRFDTARNWLLVKSLLTDPSISVQWMFLARPLKRMMLAYAKRTKEPVDLIRRADEALAQPRRSRPHNDHLHLRIACPPDDVLEGCRDIGTQRSWFRDPAPRIEARVGELMALARSDDAHVRSDAVTVLGRIGTPEARREVLARLDDADAGVRRAAAASLADGGVEGIEDLLVRRLARESDGLIASSILAALDRCADRWRRPALLASLLEIDRTYEVDLGVFEVHRTVRDWALDALGRLPTSTGVRLLVAALEAGTVPANLAGVRLRDWTGAEPDAGAPDAAAVVAAWRGWWRTHKDRSPREWWAEALRRRGLDVAEPGAARAVAASALADGGGLHRWLVESVEGALGVRLSPWDIEPMDVLLRRAANPETPVEAGGPEPDPASEGPGGTNGAADPGTAAEAGGARPRGRPRRLGCGSDRRGRP